MTQPKRPNVYLDPAAYEALNNLQAAMPGEGVPKQARLQDIASGVILYTSPQQAAGMLAAFLRHAHQQDQGTPEKQPSRESSSGATAERT